MRMATLSLNLLVLGCSPDAQGPEPAAVELGPALEEAAPPPPPISPFVRIRYQNEGLNDEQLAAWAAEQQPSSVPVQLWLDGNQLTAAAVPALAASRLHPLMSLSMSDNPLGDEGMRALATTQYYETVGSLTLAGTGITAHGAALALGPDAVFGLGYLDLSRNPLGDEGVAAIAKGPSATYLSGLYLADVGATDEAAKALAASPQLGALEHLDLSGNAITQAGREALAASASLAGCAVYWGD